MPTARILHLNRNDDARYPSMIFEIEGELYIDLPSACLFTIPPKAKDCFEFLYLMKQDKDFRQYFFDGDILVSLDDSVCVAVWGMRKTPMYIQWFTEVYQRIMDKPTAKLGIQFGWKDIVEAVYHINNRINQSELSLEQILESKLATVEVVKFDAKPSLEFRLYAFGKTIADSISDKLSEVKWAIVDAVFWAKGYFYDEDLCDYVKNKSGDRL